MITTLVEFNEELALMLSGKPSKVNKLQYEAVCGTASLIFKSEQEKITKNTYAFNAVTYCMYMQLEHVKQLQQKNPAIYKINYN